MGNQGSEIRLHLVLQYQRRVFDLQSVARHRRRDPAALRGATSILGAVEISKRQTLETDQCGFNELNKTYE